MRLIAWLVAALALPRFTPVDAGPNGGVVLTGVFPDKAAPVPLRKGFVYLPPGFSGAERYPVVYLLHGMPGDPDEYVNGLRIQEVGDELMSTGAIRPFIAVAPAAGPDVHYNGEWAGPWEDYLVRAVVPWVDRHLPTIAAPSGRTLAGLSAGGFGAVDIGLRNPGLFGRIESWSGYFTPLKDGPLKRADRETLAANDPTKLAPAEARDLRQASVHFFLSSGPTHSHWAKEEQTIAFDHPLEIAWVEPARDLPDTGRRARFPELVGDSDEEALAGRHLLRLGEQTRPVDVVFLEVGLDAVPDRRGIENVQRGCRVGCERELCDGDPLVCDVSEATGTLVTTGFRSGKEWVRGR